MHEAPQALVEGVATMHDATIVPQHEVAGPPLLIPGEALLSGVCPNGIEQLLAVFDREAVDVGAGPAAEEQRLTPGHRMQAHQRMHGSGGVADVQRALKSLALLAG